LPVVDRIEDLLGSLDLEVFRQGPIEAGGRTASVGGPEHLADRALPDPETGPLVPQVPAPPSGPGDLAGAIPAPRDRPCPAHESETHAQVRPRHEGDARVVGHDDPAPEADPPEDGP